MAQKKQPKAKPIKLTDIKKQVKAMNTFKSYVVNSEKNEVINYYEKFDKLKVQELLTKLYERLAYVEKENLNFFKTEMEFMRYLQGLIVLKFTHLGEQVGDSFEEEVEAIDYLVSKGYFKLIMDDLFDGNEVVEVIETMKKFIETVALALEHEEKTRKEIEDKVENKFILKKVDGNA